MTNGVEEKTRANASNQPKGKVRAASAKLRERTVAAQHAASGAYQSTRARAGAAYSSAKTKVSDGTERAVQAVEENPVAAVIGGLALGALVGALLPRTAQEEALLGNVGEKLRDGSRKAVDAARETGREKLGEFGLGADMIGEKLGTIVEAALSTLSSAGAAARKTI